MADEVRKVFLEQGEGSIKNCIRQVIWEASDAPLELSGQAKLIVVFYDVWTRTRACGLYHLLKR